MLGPFKKNIYSSKGAHLTDYIPYDCIVEEGVVLQKDGLIQRSFFFRGPDLGTSNELDKEYLTDTINRVQMDYEDTFAVQWEAQKYKTDSYPAADFDQIAAFLVDREREISYSNAGKHFSNRYFLTLTWKPPSEVMAKAKSFFLKKKGEKQDISKLKEDIKHFVEETNEFVAALDNVLYIRPMDDNETLTYLHSCVSLEWHDVLAPPHCLMVDEIIADTPLANGRTIMLGDKYIPMATVKEFPSETLSLMLEKLNEASIEYRWSTRFLPLSRKECDKEIEKAQSTWIGRRKKGAAAVGGALDKDMDSGRINKGALALEADADALQVEFTERTVILGKYTSTIMVWDEDYKKAIDKLNIVKNIIHSKGFTFTEQSIDPLNAFLGMMPGNVYANVRRYLITSMNMSHVIPLTATWTGQRFSDYLSETVGSDIPLLTCSTSERTPFFYNPWVGDVAHFSLFGQTGAGKSTLLGMMMIQFLKYINSKVIVFDLGGSARKMTMAVEGQYYEPGVGLGFQPLRELENEEDILWAFSFIELLYDVQEYKLSPKQKADITHVLKMMVKDNKESRTISRFSSLLEKELQDVLSPYIIGKGPYGEILDCHSDECDIDSHWTMFEMDPLLKLSGKKDQIVAPVLFYIFRKLDKSFADRNPKLIIIDEAWKLIRNQMFAEKLMEYLKVLRKYNVSVGFATQEPSDVAQSEIASTLISQCPTKIFTPDKSALQFYDVYSSLGVPDALINDIAKGEYKKDYFYFSPLGTRKFQLDLKKNGVALAYTGSEKEEYYKYMKDNKPEDVPYWDFILQTKNVDFREYVYEGEFDE